MTLTTEQIEQVIDDCRKGAAMRGLFNKWIAEEMASELLRCRDHLAELSAVANREAQPVALVDRRPAASGGICWKNGGKDLAHGTELFTAPPAPDNANPVAWEMRYWNSGYNCWHDWERITAEQHAEMSVQHAADNDYEFRILYDAPPAPAVPAEMSLARAIEIAWKDSDIDSPGSAYRDGWNACRAAMLESVAATSSIPMISDSYKLPNGWIACSESMPELDKRVLLYFGSYDGHIEDGCIGDDGDGPYHYFFDGDSLQQEPTHWMPLPAAPEGGN